MVCSPLAGLANETFGSYVNPFDTSYGFYANWYTLKGDVYGSVQGTDAQTVNFNGTYGFILSDLNGENIEPLQENILINLANFGSSGTLKIQTTLNYDTSSGDVL